MLLMCSKHRLQISSAVAGWADFSFSHNEELFSKCSVTELWGFYSKRAWKIKWESFSVMSLERGSDGLTHCCGDSISTESSTSTWTELQLQIQEKIGPNWRFYHMEHWLWSQGLIWWINLVQEDILSPARGCCPCCPLPPSSPPAPWDRQNSQQKAVIWGLVRALMKHDPSSCPCESKDSPTSPQHIRDPTHHRNNLMEKPQTSQNYHQIAAFCCLKFRTGAKIFSFYFPARSSSIYFLYVWKKPQKAWIFFAPTLIFFKMRNAFNAFC